MKLPDMIAAIAAHDLTYEDIAKRLGVSQPTISRWTKGSVPNFERIEAVRALYHELQGLTNESGTSTLPRGLELRGGLHMSGAAVWYQGSDIKQVSVDLALTEGQIAFEALETLAGFRAKRGELLIFGPEVDPRTLIDRDALVSYWTEEGSRSALCYLAEGRSGGRYDIRTAIEVLARDAAIQKAHKFLGLLAAGEWRRLP